MSVASQHQAAFETLLLEAFADPVRADYDTLRARYVLSERYQPWYRDQEGLEELRMRMAMGEWEGSLVLAGELVEGDPLFIDLRFMLSRIFDHAGQDYEASLQRTFGNGLLRSVLRSGDGRSAKTAIRVIDPRELKLALESMNLKACHSQLRKIGDRWLEAISCLGSGGERLMFFDVDSSQRWLIRLHG